MYGLWMIHIVGDMVSFVWTRVGFEESTFNLADLVRHNREARDEDDESGIGHAEHRNMMSPQPGQSDDTLSDQVEISTTNLQH